MEKCPFIQAGPGARISIRCVPPEKNKNGEKLAHFRLALALAIRRGVAVVYELCSMREQRGFCRLWSKSFALVYGFS